MVTRYAHITGWGACAPENVVTNDDLAQLVPTSDEWIRGRTGIRERRVAGPDEYTSTFATRAGQRALELANLDPARLDMVIVATSTPDQMIPSTACVVQDALGATNAAAFDLVAACSGFVYGLSIGTAMIRNGDVDNVLVIGAEALSRVMDWTDRATCVIFGDGAGAVVLQASELPGGVLRSALHADGSGGDLIQIGFGVRNPYTIENVTSGASLLKMSGSEVFRFATRILSQSVKEVTEPAGLALDDIDLIIPHQANTRILQVAAKQLGVPMERMFVNLDRFGNTSAASVPLALVDAIDAGRVHAGDRVVLVAFGGGLTWASCLVEWCYGPEDREWPLWRRGLHGARYRLARARMLLHRAERRLAVVEDRLRRRNMERNGFSGPGPGGRGE